MNNIKLLYLNLILFMLAILIIEPNAVSGQHNNRFREDNNNRLSGDQLTYQSGKFNYNNNNNNINNLHNENDKIYYPGKTSLQPKLNYFNQNDQIGANDERRSGSVPSNSFATSHSSSASAASSTSSLKHDSKESSEESHEHDSKESVRFSNKSRRNNSERDQEAAETRSSTRNAGSSSDRRLCERKYTEFIERIFPQESDTATDANDIEFNGRILAAPGEYPHMSALGFRDRSGRIEYKCGGSLISEKFVITAAHCVNFTGQAPSKVRIGDLNLLEEEKNLEPQIRDIKRIYSHPEYTSKSYYNDIALLELVDEVDLTEFVRPIRLWIRPNYPFTLAYAMGYGSTAFARKITNRLTNLNMTIIPNDECNTQMPQIPETQFGIIDSQVCAQDYALNRDTCQGDSGGPLQLNLEGRRRRNRLHYHLIGITSYGLSCQSGYPSIFTRVYSYLDWIERIVWRDEF